MTARVSRIARSANTGASFRRLAATTSTLALLALAFAPSPGRAQTVTTTGDVQDGFGPVTPGSQTNPWTPNTYLSVGKFNVGTLDIGDGASVTSGYAYIGESDDGVGTVTVDGAGSTWTVNGGLSVGMRGKGTLNITNGGTVTSGGAWIGHSSTNSNPVKVNTVNVGGAGSRWTVGGTLFVGGDDYGTGVLNITEGGSVSSTTGRIGYKGWGTATVTGADSIWTIRAETEEGNPIWAADALIIASDTPGILTIADGGQVDVTGGIKIAVGTYDSGTLELNGTDGARGVLKVQTIVKGAGHATVTFDGGILRAARSGGDLLDGFAAGDVTIATGGAFIDSNGYDVDISSPLGGAGGLTKQGTGTLTLTAANSYAGGTIVEGGVLQLSGAGTLGATTGALTVASGAVLDLNDTSQTVGALSGAGSVVNWSINGNPIGLTVNQNTDTTFSGSISSYFDEIDGVTTHLDLTKSGTGTLTLTGVNTLNGETRVTGGTLLIDGSLGPVYWGPMAQGAAPVTVESGGTLGGSGTIDGKVTVLSGGALSGVQGQTLTMRNLELTQNDAGNTPALNVNLGAPDAMALFNVQGENEGEGNVHVTGNAVVNVTAQPSFGAGLYRLVNYTGVLSFSEGELTVGAAPTGYAVDDLEVVTSVDHQINLLVSPASGNGGEGGNTGTYSLWDGANTTANGAVDGGSGTWNATNTNWTNSAGSANGPYDHSAMLIFAGTAGTITVDAGEASSLAVSAGGMQFADGGFVVQGDDLALGAGTTVIRVGDGTSAGADYTATIAAKLTGSGGLAKADLGKLILTGANTYSGPTAVRAGTLAVNGSLTSAVTVESGARLGGTGTVGGIIALSGGTVAPGNSIGTLNVAGDVTFAAGSFYEVETNPAGQADKIAATGTATLQGGTVHVLAGSGNYAPSTTYTILTANGGRSGQFAGVDSNFAFLTPTLSYNATDVILTLTRNAASFAGIGTTPNQQAAGAGVESLEWGDPIWDAAVQLDADTARAAFDALSGEIHASAKTALLEDSRFVRDAALDRLRASDAGHRAIWGRAFGSWGHIRGDGNAARLERSTGGLFLGADGAISDTVHLGVLAGYSRTDFDVRARASSGDSDNYHLGAYAGGQWGPIAVRAGIAHTWHRLDTTRSVAFPRVSDTLRGKYKAGTTQVFGEVGYGIAAGSATVEPFANLAYVNLHTDGFTERGGAAALTAKGESVDATFSTLGLRGSSGLGSNLKATAALGWRHAFGDLIPLSGLALAGSDRFTVAGLPVARDAATVDAGLDLAIGDTIALGIAYNGQFGSGIADHGARFNISVKF
jgi:outer membrane autotransporter protein